MDRRCANAFSRTTRRSLFCEADRHRHLQRRATRRVAARQPIEVDIVLRRGGLFVCSARVLSSCAQLVWARCGGADPRWSARVSYMSLQKVRSNGSSRQPTRECRKLGTRVQPSASAAEFQLTSGYVSPASSHSKPRITAQPRDVVLPGGIKPPSAAAGFQSHSVCGIIIDGAVEVIAGGTRETTSRNAAGDDCAASGAAVQGGRGRVPGGDGGAGAQRPRDAAEMRA